MRVTDHYADGDGRVHVALLGLLPVVNAENPDIAKSAAERLLAEMCWQPTVFLPQLGAVSVRPVRCSYRGRENFRWLHHSLTTARRLVVWNRTVQLVCQLQDLAVYVPLKWADVLSPKVQSLARWDVVIYQYTCIFGVRRIIYK